MVDATFVVVDAAVVVDTVSVVVATVVVVDAGAVFTRWMRRSNRFLDENRI